LPYVDRQVVAGIGCETWWSTFCACHNFGDDGVHRIEWPTPGGLAEQEQVVVDAFAIIASEINIMRASRG